MAQQSLGRRGRVKSTVCEPLEQMRQVETRMTTLERMVLGRRPANLRGNRDSTQQQNAESDVLKRETAKLTRCIKCGSTSPEQSVCVTFHVTLERDVIPCRDVIADRLKALPGRKNMSQGVKRTSYE